MGKRVRTIIQLNRSDPFSHPFSHRDMVELRPTSGMKILSTRRMDDARWRIVIGLTNVNEGQQQEALEVTVKETGDEQKSFVFPVTYYGIADRAALGAL